LVVIKNMSQYLTRNLFGQKALITTKLLENLFVPI